MSNPEMLDPLPIRRTLVPAAGATLPVTSAPNSAFAAGALAKAAARRPREPLNAVAVVIHSGIPCPPNDRKSQNGGYRALLDRMQVGTHVQLPLKQGRALMSASKRLVRGTEVYAFRRLSTTHCGVWRIA